MTIKAHYLFWLLMALVAGAWPLAMPYAHAASPQSAITQVDANQA